jgi:hypothetical protein
MCNILKLLSAEWFGKKESRLDGSNLFSNEYINSNQYTSIIMLFGKGSTPFIRMPLQSTSITSFLTASRLAYSRGIEVIALLDAYESNTSIMNRLNTIKTQAPYIKYIQLFNELPHMIDLYPGEKIQNLKELLDKTNQYADWIHQNISGSKVITMGPYNCMDKKTWDVWNKVSNIEILKQLILYTVADIAAVHLYGDSLGKKLQLVDLSDNIKKWNDEATKKGYPKKIYITECGSEPWNSQVKYYDNIIKLICNTINPDVIIWYRQCVKLETDQDNGYAIETLNNSKVSPLYDHLIS